MNSDTEDKFNIKYSRKEGKKYRVDWQDKENLLEYEHEGRYIILHHSILDDELYKFWEGDLAELERAEEYWLEEEIKRQSDPDYWESYLQQFEDTLTDEQREVVEDLADNKEKSTTAQSASQQAETNTNVFKVQIASEVVRDGTMNDVDFVIYAKLVQLFQKSGQKESYKVDYRQIMYFLDIRDNRTLKKCLVNLHKRGLLLNEIKNLPKKQPLSIMINPEYIPAKGKSLKFTQLPHTILDLYVIKNISYTGVRILYYLESYIDRTKTFLSEHVAYPAMETIGSDTKNSRTTVDKYIEKLEKAKLIKIDRFYFKSTGEYSDDDVEIFTRYHNKYHVRLENFQKVRDKWKEKELNI